MSDRENRFQKELERLLKSCLSIAKFPADAARRQRAHFLDATLPTFVHWAEQNADEREIARALDLNERVRAEAVPWHVAIADEIGHARTGHLYGATRLLNSVRDARRELGDETVLRVFRGEFPDRNL